MSAGDPDDAVSLLSPDTVLPPPMSLMVGMEAAIAKAVAEATAKQSTEAAVDKLGKPDTSIDAVIQLDKKPLGEIQSQEAAESVVQVARDKHKEKRQASRQATATKMKEGSSTPSASGEPGMPSSKLIDRISSAQRQRKHAEAHAAVIAAAAAVAATAAAEAVQAAAAESAATETAAAATAVVQAAAAQAAAALATSGPLRAVPGLLEAQRLQEDAALTPQPTPPPKPPAPIQTRVATPSAVVEKPQSSEPAPKSPEELRAAAITRASLKASALKVAAARKVVTAAESQSEYVVKKSLEAVSSTAGCGHS